MDRHSYESVCYEVIPLIFFIFFNPTTPILTLQHQFSLVKIHWYLLKLSSGNENTDLSRADNSVKNWQNLPMKSAKPDLHNIYAHTELNKNPLI